MLIALELQLVAAAAAAGIVFHLFVSFDLNTLFVFYHLPLTHIHKEHSLSANIAFGKMLLHMKLIRMHGLIEWYALQHMNCKNIKRFFFLLLFNFQWFSSLATRFFSVFLIKVIICLVDVVISFILCKIRARVSRWWHDIHAIFHVKLIAQVLHGF